MQNDAAKRIYFGGHVQGVGFRYTVRSIAEGFSVSGYAMNLPDGRVEVFAQGDQEEINRFVAAIKREFDTYIRTVDIEDSAVQADLKRFQIRLY
jgi:acylphosphatase